MPNPYAPEAAVLLEQSPLSMPPGVVASASPEQERHLPLYLDQLVRFAAEGGDEPPAKLSDLVALRIERLPAARRRVLQAIAVLGDGAPVERDGHTKRRVGVEHLRDAFRSPRARHATRRHELDPVVLR